MATWKIALCVTTIGLVACATANAGGTYAGLTRSQAKHEGAIDMALELETKGRITEKQTASVISKLLRSKATFTKTTCVVLPTNVGVIVGQPKGLELKPFWLVTFSAEHERIWESKPRGLTACTRDPTNTAIFADSFGH